MEEGEEKMDGDNWRVSYLKASARAAYNSARLFTVRLYISLTDH